MNHLSWTWCFLGVVVAWLSVPGLLVHLRMVKPVDLIPETHDYIANYQTTLHLNSRLLLGFRKIELRMPFTLITTIAAGTGGVWGMR